MDLSSKIEAPQILAAESAFRTSCVAGCFCVVGGGLTNEPPWQQQHL
jgi:hypothetical protein